MELKAAKQKQLYVGSVVSDKMNKTVVVEMEQTYKHSKFHKILRRTKKYKVHDENNQAKAGDIIEFYEGRPVSKTKYMYLAQIVKSHIE